MGASQRFETVCASPLKRERTIVLRVVRSTQKEVRRCRTRERGSLEKLECFDSYGSSTEEDLYAKPAKAAVRMLACHVLRLFQMGASKPRKPIGDKSAVCQ